MTSIGDLAELNIIIDTAAGVEENVLGFKATATTASLDGLASDFNTNFLQQWLTQSVTSTSCSRLDVVDVVPGVLATKVFTVSPAKAGAVTGDQLPPQNALVLSWRSDLKGRSFRGRSFTVAHGESQQAGGIWTAGIIAAYDTIIDNYLARYGLADPVAHWRACVISRFSGGVRRVPPIGTFITDGSLDVRVRSQRRRQK